MITATNPASIHPPLGAYAHTVKIPADADLLMISGQVGMDAGGKLAKGVGAQAEQVFRNILACLEANGMAARDLVKLTILLVDAGDVAAVREARTAILGPDVKPASTLMVISALAAPELLVEIEAVAARK